MAPEIYQNQHYTKKADVYSFGIVLWEIICRQTPYQDLKNPQAIMFKVTIQKGRPALTKIPRSIPKQVNYYTPYKSHPK